MEAQDRNVPFFRFEDLRIYGKSNEYCAWLLGSLLEPINAADRNLIDAFCNAAFDVPLNIAEGSSRNKTHFEHYLKIAKTAVRQCYVYTTIAGKRGLLNEECVVVSGERLMEMTRMIGALIVSLNRNHGQKGYENCSDEESNNTIGELEAIDTNF